MPLFSRKGRARDRADAVYAAIVAQARLPAFYTGGGVPDTLEGRFEMLLLCGWLYFRRLRSEDDGMRRLGQSVFDAMFRDMDAQLREIGIGDLTVPKKIKAMGEAFYGRATAYDAGIADRSGRALAEALARNIWPDDAAGGERADRLALWVRQADAALLPQPASQLGGDGPRFPPFLPAEQGDVPSGAGS